MGRWSFPNQASTPPNAPTDFLTFFAQGNAFKAIDDAGGVVTLGSTILTGSGVPAGSLGKIDDLYIDGNNGDFYTKTGISTWTLAGNLTGPGVANTVSIATIGTPDVATVQRYIDFDGSSGVLSGADASDNGDGTIAITDGKLFIKANDILGDETLSFEITSKASLALTDNAINFVYIEHNFGSPQYIATTIQRTDFNTNILILTLTRAGTVLHLNAANKHLVSDSVNNTLLRLKATRPFEKASGGVIADAGNLDFSVTEGIFWQGLTPITIPTIDTSLTGLENQFIYIFRNGSGGFVREVGQSEIDNLRFDDGSGARQDLNNNQYGVHFDYAHADGSHFMVLGRGSFTLAQAEEEARPSDLPIELLDGGIFVGKIIVLKNATILEQVLSAFADPTVLMAATSHQGLSLLQGGNATERFHLTAAQHSNLLAARTALAALAIDFSGSSIKTKTITENSTFTFSNIIADNLDRVITLELTGDFAITLPGSTQNKLQVENAYDGTKLNWLYFNLVDVGTPKIVATLITGD